MINKSIWAAVLALFPMCGTAGSPCEATQDKPPTSVEASAADTPQWVTPAVVGPRLTQRILRSESAKVDVSYHVLVPEGYDRQTSRRFPVLYWLHGTGGGLGRVSLIANRFDAAMKSGEIPPMIVVFPYGLPAGMWIDSKNGSTPVESMLIKDLIPHVDTCMRTIAKRESRLLEGFSMGGYGAARLAFRHPRLFAAVLIVASGPLQPELWSAPRASPQERAKLMDRVYGNDMAFFREQSPWTQAEIAVKSGSSLPKLQILIGRNDETYPANLEFHRHLMKLGIKHDYIELPGVGHALPGYWTALGSEIWSFYREGLTGMTGE